MNLSLTCASAILLATVSHAQRSSISSDAASLTLRQGPQSVAPAATPGGFSGGGASCATPTVIGIGPQSAVSFDSTVPLSAGAATNPFEVICEHAGQQGITNEEWFAWTAASTGVASINVCGQSAVDTKIAIYADNCPMMGTLDPLACKDYTYGCAPTFLQTQVRWDITAGTTYLFQVGTFPTAPGGVGAFDIVESPARLPGQYDSGTSVNATGTNGAANFDFMIGHTYDAGPGQLVNSVDIAWGWTGVATPLPAGLNSRLVIYSGDENSLVYLADQPIIQANANTDTFVNYPLTTPVAVSGVWSVAVVTRLDGTTNGAQFPFGWDDTINSLDGATGLTRAWDAIEQANAPFDIMNPGLAQAPPLRTQTGGDDKVWMLRANTTSTATTFNDLCNGDGGNGLGCTDCPCGNNAPMGSIGGCVNSGGAGTRLIGSGDPSVSLPSGVTTDLRLAVVGAPANAFCILNSGDGVAPGNVANPCFGMDSGAQAAVFDGLRCAIANTRRHGGRSADANGDIGVTNNPWGGEGGPPVGLAVGFGGFLSGQTRYFQVINRDDPLAVCGRGLNTSQAVEVTFTP